MKRCPYFSFIAALTTPTKKILNKDNADKNNKDPLQLQVTKMSQNPE